MKTGIVFHDATIVDGTGADSWRGDVVTQHDRIVAVVRAKSLPKTFGVTHVDASGLVLSPGFIDIHTHSDFTLPCYPRAMSMTMQGVTTQVAGNCGFSPFPVDGRRGDLLREYTAFLDGGLPWGAWSDADGFMTFVSGLPLAVNLACQVGHGSVRIAAMGFEEGPPSRSQMEEMKGFVAAAMIAGAYGMSSGLTYAPASLAETAELVELAKVVGKYGGFYSTHLRNEAITLVEALGEALRIGSDADVPVQVSHHKAMGRANWHKVATTLEMVDQAVVLGQDVTLDQYPYTASSTGLVALLPAWSLSGGIDQVVRRLSTPAEREKIRNQIVLQSPADLMGGLREFAPDEVVLADGPSSLERYIGMTLTEVAAARQELPVDTVLDLIMETRGEVLTVVHGQSEENIQKIMKHGRSMIASDGWTLSPTAGGRPHPRSYGTFSRVLGSYVREEHVLRLEEAVRKMTSLPARRLGFRDRGLIREGHAADLVLFDPASVSDRATFEDPHQLSVGVQMVVVNGVVVVEGGVDTGAAPGRVLRKKVGAARG